VLYRSHFHALELQLELTRRNIPFSITSGIRFFEQAHIKDVTAYLKLVMNPRDELSFKRLAQLLPGIGGKGADKLWRAFNSAVGPRNVEHPPDARLAVALQSCTKSVPKKATLAWAQFTTTISQLESPDVRQSAARMIPIVIEAGYDDYLKENFANYRSRLDDLKQLAIFAQQFETVDEFLTQMALLTNVEAEVDQQAANRDDEKIRLSTIHQAKGLEFDVVFVIMLCDGLFPSARSMESSEGEEEERRLFYVSVTRAKNELYLAYPLMRAGYGNAGVTMQQPSRFLGEIPEDCLDEWNLRTYG
jgi:DNA helicase-2/ATP-dependent DNA helicase PcrA